MSKKERPSKIKVKRKSRPDVVLDDYDLYILWFLADEKRHNISEIKSFMNISDKGLVIHLERLSRLKLIVVARLEEDYKRKFAMLTEEGTNLWLVFAQTEVYTDLIKRVSEVKSK